MNIILATEVIHPGGAETFVLRLAKALQKSGHDVQIFIFYSYPFHSNLYESFANGVPLILADIPFPWMLGKVDSLLFRLKIDLSVRNIFIKRSLKKLLAKKKPDIIHSHLLKTDKICLEIAKQFGIPVVNTIHGDYLQFYNKTRSHIPIPLLNYAVKAESNLKALNHIVCISDRQISFFKDVFAEASKGKLSKIYNGYDGLIPRLNGSPRKMLGIQADDFVFGMVSRGIAEKGWQIAIDAFIKLNDARSHLMLVGDSDYLTTLRNLYLDHKNIHFIGHSDTPLEWIQVMDAGLLPTTYMSESLPTVVIEYLCCGIPVIASDAGEIVNMIHCEGKPAGVITPIRNNAVDVNEVCNAMQEYLENKELYNEHKANAALCYRFFDMKKCIDAYCNVYDNAIKANRQKN